MINTITNTASRSNGLSFVQYALTTVAILFATVLSVNAAPLYTAVAVSDVGVGNNIGQANTSRNIAVAPNGDIFVVFSGSMGIRVAKSTDNGQNFSASVPVAAGNYEAEIEIESGGYIYVSWLVGASVYFSRSTDAGATFSAPSVIGFNSSGSGVHIASYGSNVYLLEKDGNRFYYNNNYGSGAFTGIVIDAFRVFSDVRVDPTNGYVYVMTDDPFLRLYKSTNNGTSFTQTTISPAGSIFYSSYTLSVGSLGTFMFVSGSGTQAYKINVTTGGSTSQTYGNNFISQGRTLASDQYGNLVDGYANSGFVKYRVSFDQGTTWQTEVSVASASSHNVVINPNNYSILAVYSNNNQVYLSVYQNELAVPLSVVTGSVTNVTCNSADVAGSVTNPGAGTVTARGVVYGTSANPTTANNVATSGSGAGTFTASLSNLCPGTLYYARAYATDSFGDTWYGDNVTFTTLTPTFSVSFSPSQLWPPNHTLRTITATVTSDMACGGSCVLTSITSNESDNGLGDGDKPNDIQNAATGTEDFSFDLRAERSGTGTGRIYTITYTVTDACGAQYTVSGTVTVPFSMRKEGFASDAKGNNTIEIYPNPAEDYINVDLNFIYTANATISLTDLMGKTVSTDQVNGTSSIRKQIDMQNLAPGTYFINVQFGEEHFVKTIIKN